MKYDSIFRSIFFNFLYMVSKKMAIKMGMLATAGIVFSGVLAGCNTISSEKGEKNENPMAPSAEISEEAFAKAMDNYLAKNQIAFGGKVVDSVNAFTKEQQKNKSAEKESKMKSVPNPTAADHIQGAASPEFVLFEYSDYHCPYCQKFYPIGEEFVKKNSNVQLVFRPLPLAHANTATPLHEVAECIAKISGNESFWKFTDAVFADTSISGENYGLALTRLNIAGADAIKACYDSGEMKAVIKKSVDDGLAMGIEGTPNNILKNMKTGEIVLLEGAYPLSELEKAMEQLKK